uniref:adenylate cyclase n=1 Tax=Glaucocystis sp. BC-2016 TaxID=1802912 RepID=A0A126X0P6_9EUKA|nr:putative LOV domain-containing protein [Glaucocystis sp. BC-2016]
MNGSAGQQVPVSGAVSQVNDHLTDSPVTDVAKALESLTCSPEHVVHAQPYSRDLDLPEDCLNYLGKTISSLPRSDEGFQLHTISNPREDINHLLRLAVGSTREGIVISDMRTPCRQPLIFVNRGFEDMTGYRAEDILGRNCNFLQGPDTEREDVTMISEAIRAKKPLRIEILNYRKDGTKFWNYLSLTPIIDLAGNLTHFIGVQFDITERKQLEYALKREQMRSEALLLNILPWAIAEELKEKSVVAARHQQNISILFADITGFTELADTMAAEDLVNNLNRIFSQFDELADKYRLEKIKTMGDCYMVAGGLPQPMDDCCTAMAMMALDMMDRINSFVMGNGKKINMRIGVHCGSCIAGVIGTKKFVYDVWGGSVNMASRMESHGVPGKIQVSKDFYEHVRDNFNFEKRGTIHVKGKGPMCTYFLLSRKSDTLKPCSLGTCCNPSLDKQRSVGGTLGDSLDLPVHPSRATAHLSSTHSPSFEPQRLESPADGARAPHPALESLATSPQGTHLGSGVVGLATVAATSRPSPKRQISAPAAAAFASLMSDPFLAVRRVSPMPSPDQPQLGPPATAVLLPDMPLLHPTIAATLVQEGVPNTSHLCPPRL